MKRPPRRAVNGLLLLDKPVGLTSNEALQKVKRLYNADKAGHTGSLDPLASGMLPLCFGEATKFSQYLLDADKRYRVEAQLGVRTASGDAEGAVIERHPVGTITEQALQAVLSRFCGRLKQVPSMYSAIKVQGQPLYKLARQGIEVAREARDVTVYTLRCTGHEGDRLHLDIHCSKGMYVRTLVDDIGLALGCGAHVVALRRLTVGPYEENQMVTWEALERDLAQGGQAALDAHLLPVATCVAHWPAATLSSAAAYYLRQGQPVIVPYSPKAGWVRLMHKNGEFLGVGEILEDGKVAPRRLVQS